ncbi:MAG TPA: hypothetical protein VN895_10225, partial [Candidatus Acidoferrum sp.]|nr:hypothetical protein [Candidatus Acidoferrum sp.]
MAPRQAAPPAPTTTPAPALASSLDRAAPKQDAFDVEVKASPANASLNDMPEAERLHRIKAAVHDRIIG